MIVRAQIPRSCASHGKPLAIRSRKHDRDDDDNTDEDEEPSARRVKRQKDRSRPLTPTSPYDYADHVRSCYEEGERWSFKGTTRDTLNQSQHKAFYNFLNFCVSIVNLLIAQHIITLPVGILFGAINYAHDLLSMNDGNPHGECPLSCDTTLDTTPTPLLETIQSTTSSGRAAAADGAASATRSAARGTARSASSTTGSSSRRGSGP